MQGIDDIDLPDLVCIYQPIPPFPDKIAIRAWWNVALNCKQFIPRDVIRLIARYIILKNVLCTACGYVICRPDYPSIVNPCHADTHYECLGCGVNRPFDGVLVCSNECRIDVYDTLVRDGFVDYKRLE